MTQLKRYSPAFAVFAVVLLQGSLIGLTDDEAYYWVLAQKPAFGYAFHPPAVALCIAASQALFGGFLGHHSALLVRLPAALSAGLLIALGMRWMERAGAGPKSSTRGAWALVSLVGFFSLSWMMVPDLPLFVGWTLAFVAGWEISFASQEEFKNYHYAELAFGLALAILSKYSGILAAPSATLAILLWAPRKRVLSAALALALGCLLAGVPIFWWNATHEWASILYQIRERHGDATVSWVRYARFWAIELVLAGPPLLAFGVGLLGRAWRRNTAPAEKYVLAWLLPGALVFCLQPLWADFKPHWALIVWWPLVLVLGWAWASDRIGRLARGQVVYGVGLGLLVLVSCHVPLAGWLAARILGHSLDSRFDITNDLYGWSDLPAALARSQGPAALQIPIIGSRYQTAAQAAFAMGEGARVTLLPRDLKSRDEWPNLEVSAGQGPEWPVLTQTVFYVGDNRYDAGPEFPGAHCAQVMVYEKLRAGMLAKRLLLWRCEPHLPLDHAH